LSYGNERKPQNKTINPYVPYWFLVQGGGKNFIVMIDRVFLSQSETQDKPEGKKQKQKQKRHSTTKKKNSLKPGI
jgi:hypothetical protein